MVAVSLGFRMRKAQLIRVRVLDSNLEVDWVFSDYLMYVCRLAVMWKCFRDREMARCTKLSLTTESNSNGLVVCTVDAHQMIS